MSLYSCEILARCFTLNYFRVIADLELFVRSIARPLNRARIARYFLRKFFFGQSGGSSDVQRTADSNHDSERTFQLMVNRGYRAPRVCRLLDQTLAKTFSNATYLR